MDAVPIIDTVVKVATNRRRAVYSLPNLTLGANAGFTFPADSIGVALRSRAMPTTIPFCQELGKHKLAATEERRQRIVWAETQELKE
jgi:hypothetical protein